MTLLLVLALLLDPTPRAAPSASPVLPEVRAAAVLHAWDVRRARAWSAGDPVALRDLYVPGSAAGRADVAMLRAWTGRELRVERLRMQLLSISVVSWRRNRLVVEVVDRVTGARVVPTRSALPADRATAHTIVLRQVAGEWRVTSVG